MPCCGKPEEQKKIDILNKKIEFSRAKTAINICKECDHLIIKMGIPKCNLCGCYVHIKIYASTIIDYTCPINKW